MTITADGPGWELWRLAVTDHRHPNPHQHIDSIPAARIATRPSPRPAVSTGTATSLVTPLALAFRNDGIAEERDHLLDWFEIDPQRRRTPDDLPGNCPTRLWASKRLVSNRPHYLAISLNKAPLHGGGVALLVHPFRPNRTQLRYAYGKTGGARIPGAIRLALDGNAWQTVILPLPPAVEAKTVDTVVIEDADTKLGTPFLVAKAVAVAGRLPTPADLDLRPQRALRFPERKALEALLGKIEKARGWATWQAEFKPEAFGVLAGIRLGGLQLRKDLYAVLERERGRPTTNGTLADLILNDSWLDEKFIVPKHLIRAQEIHVQAVAPAGADLLLGLTVEQAVRNFWAKMLDESVKSGVLPVIVLGPDKVDEGRKPLATALWAGLESLAAKEHPGVPTIDLRPVPVRGPDRFAKGGRQLCADLLAEGLTELEARLRLLRDRTRP